MRRNKVTNADIEKRCACCVHFHELPERAFDGGVLWGRCDVLKYNRLTHNGCDKHERR